MGLCASKNAAVIEEKDWPEDIKEAVKEIEGWENEKALEAAKAAASSGKDKDAVMEAATNAKEGIEDPAKEEEEPAKGEEEDEKQETAPEATEPVTAE
mmetsp:Transcript_25152/g.42851  ORF Transcript_25152/g.42851 Transcript_25152/m.42851 type:complete len:98 (+) Transcript_25152:193-486(+)|eukprot:CAMPEP_0116543978 /NCGR_PEP_ID=MMETSP0397-20121206/1863_1 /TAXON_ID=216820 /ORGANISM="Cyclophora tenuis, Strain ECT3854" /LENGTH=97 /DNA_ID=CAMNT_0004068141 /DNA_START=110 /DNA_END=403 /DNA_ORIENTATION=-